MLSKLPVPIWGSAVGHTVRTSPGWPRGCRCRVQAVEITLSCPNLDGQLIALDPLLSAKVTAAVKSAVDVPVGAKLSPNAADIASVALACADAGADWVVLTNTIWGAGIDIETRRPLLSGVTGGYSGPPLKPIALRCVIEVHQARPELPIVVAGAWCRGQMSSSTCLRGHRRSDSGRFISPSRALPPDPPGAPRLCQRFGVPGSKTWSVRPT